MSTAPIDVKLLGWGGGGGWAEAGDLNSDQFFCSNAQPQGSHPGPKKCKSFIPESLLLVKRTQRMIKSPYHG